MKNKHGYNVFQVAITAQHCIPQKKASCFSYFSKKASILFFPEELFRMSSEKG